ncbi:ATP-binding cassette sub-family A member 2-like [Ornithodoros turicata]|uniref:ATP-binding cassette sub-family A member 2-like n=1 Tax=Ornithodoros turicata TaxID=34597 RepID=UPI003139AE0B
MGLLSQLSVFLWKNLYVQKVKRHYLLVISELVVALAAFAMVEHDRPLPPANMKEAPYLSLQSQYPNRGEEYLEHPTKLLYTPANRENDRLLEEAFNASSGVELLGYANHAEMMVAFKKMAPAPASGPDQHVVTLFLEVHNNSQLQFIIGFYDNTDFIDRRKKDMPVFEPLPDPVTQRVTVARIQIALNRAHRKLMPVSNLVDIEVSTQRLPQGPHPLDSSPESRRHLMVLRLAVAFGLPFIIIILTLVRENQSGMKEHLMLMGMRDMAYWLGHFLPAFIFGMIVTSVIMLYMLFADREGHHFLEGTNSLLVFVFMFIFCAQYSAIALFFSVFFTNTVPALLFAVCYWVLSSVVPFLTIEDWSGRSMHYIMLGHSTKTLTSLFLPCMGPHWCFRILGCANLAGDPYSFGSISVPVLNLDNVTMAGIWMMMILSIICSCILLWYFGNVLPWAKGLSRPPWFPFTPQYWCPARVGTHEKPAVPDGVRFEADPLDVEPAVFVNRLVLEKQQTYILHETNFKTFPGEITVVLGPPASGKTSLVNAIAGVMQPARGQVIVCGFDMTEETRQARSQLSLCPKRDILFDDFTVWETLWFFGTMRDMKHDLLRQKITETMNIVALTEFSSTLAGSLDAAHRRFLSVGVAIVATPRVIVLDAPAHGLGPLEQEFLWGVLAKVKVASPTSIIITTSEVACEAFADRIAILGYGAMKCHGTRAFVRHRFGCGYNFRFIKMKRFQAKQCMDTTKKHVPEAYALSDHKEAMVLGLGETVSPATMSNLTFAFEDNYPKLGIAHCGPLFTTMEDVFIRLVLELDNNPPSVAPRPLGMTMSRRTSRSRRMSAAGTVAEDWEVSGQNVIIPTQKYIAGMTSQEEYYESQGEIENHIHALWNLKPGKSSHSQVFKALLGKRAFYTRQTWALPLFCWLLPTAILFWLCFIESSSQEWHFLKVTPDNIVYDLDLVYPGANAFVAYAASTSSKTEEAYKKTLENMSPNVTTFGDAVMFLQRLSQERVPVDNLVVGAEFKDENKGRLQKVTAFYSGDYYHSQAVSLNLVNTALLRYLTGNDKSKVTAVLRPHRSDVQKVESERISNNHLTDHFNTITKQRIARLVFVPVATSLLISSYVFFPIDERATRSKTMQLLSGVSPLAYWGANYVWDLIAAFVSLLCMFFPIMICHPGASRLFGHIIILTLAYVHSVVPLVYIFSFVTDSMTTGFLVLVGLLSLTGVSSTLGYQRALMASEHGIELFMPVSRSPALYFLYLLPPFSYHWALVNLAQLDYENFLCSNQALVELHDMCSFIQGSTEEAAVLLNGMRYCCGELFRNNMTYLSTLGALSLHRDSAAMELLVMLFEGVIFLMMLVTVERGVFRPLVTSRVGPSPPEKLKPDVADERRLVEKTLADKDFSKAALVVHDIQKIYGKRSALQGVSFILRPGECVVVLGLRESGKSLLLEVLAGITAPSGGSAFMPDGVSLSDLEKWRQNIGVCPQYDGILGKLTVRQTLWLYANLRGIESSKVHDLVTHIIELLNLRYYDSMYVYTCNPATRRKLAVGIAIIGLPPVVLMDDPATGLDLLAKKKIYDTIRLIRELVCAAVLVVTPSMSDSVVISNRMAVMSHGQFQSIGTTKEVHSRLCRGCHLAAVFPPGKLVDVAAFTAVDNIVKTWFPGATVLAVLHNTIEYTVELKTNWTKTFKSLGDLKAQLQAEDVQIGEASLERVMLRSGLQTSSPLATVRV